MFTTDLRQSFREHRDRIALELAQREYTYSELEQAAVRVAALFQSKGVRQGDRVLLYLVAKEPFLLAYLGALWAGAVPLPLNPGFKLAEGQYFATDSVATLILHDSATAQVSHEIRNACPSIRELVSADDVLTSSASTRFQPVEPRPDDPALMLYSSGTTGEPKGVVHTQANLGSAVRAIIDAWRFTPDDVLANALPLFHIHGLSFATNVCLLSGASMLVGESFHPTRTFDLIDRATVFMAVPPYYYSFLKRDELRTRVSGWKQLRLATCGSAPIRTDVLAEVEAILRQPIINRYGMTECHVLTSLPLDGPWPHGSVGVPLGGIEVVVRRADGQPCSVGEVGSVFARGPNLFREYWRRPDATRESFGSEGWFDTGDLGERDANGFLTLVGRSKDLIIVGGFNVYPAVVERVLCEYPGVCEAAVIGLPDERRGERVCAFVVSDDTLDTRQIRRFCLDRLADYQCPSVIHAVPALPRNAMGKVLKRELRNRA